MNIGLIGFGYWGDKLARVIDANSNCKLSFISDLDPDLLEKAKIKYPNSKVSNDFKSYLNSSVDLVIVATPSNTHFEIAKKVLESNIHLWIEKPMTTNIVHANELISLAAERKLLLHVDHTYLFSPEIKQIKNYIDQGKLGKLHYFDSVRINLGKFQEDVNVVYDLAPHDLSILLYLTGEKPISVQAMGRGFNNEENESIAYFHLEFNSGLIAHCHINWLSPVKIRKIIIAGDNQMITFDDTLPAEKIKIYDKGVVSNVHKKEEIDQIKYQYRYGNTISPHIPYSEPLSNELNYVINCIDSGSESISGADLGLTIVKIIDAIELSLKDNSKKIFL